MSFKHKVVLILATVCNGLSIFGGSSTVLYSAVVSRVTRAII